MQNMACKVHVQDCMEFRNYANQQIYVHLFNHCESLYFRGPGFCAKILVIPSKLSLAISNPITKRKCRNVKGKRYLAAFDVFTTEPQHSHSYHPTIRGFTECM